VECEQSEEKIKNWTGQNNFLQSGGETELTRLLRGLRYGSRQKPHRLAQSLPLEVLISKFSIMFTPPVSVDFMRLNLPILLISEDIPESQKVAKSGKHSVVAVPNHSGMMIISSQFGNFSFH
jgi:hypothetical protein